MLTSTPATDAESYKALARTWAATVTVVTARLSGAGEPRFDGFTCTAFLMASIDPPILVVSAGNTSRPAAMIREAAAIAVNFLAPGQASVGGAFARPAAERAALWTELAWTPDADGAPLLDGVVGAFSARVRQLVDAGDHTLALLDVTAIHRSDAVDTLVYHNRAFGRVVREG